MHSFFKKTKRTVFFITFSFFALLLSFSSPAYTFNPSEVLRTEDFFYLPISFSSADRIQNFLEYHNSVLADYMVDISFESDDIMISPDIFPGKPDRLIPYYAMQPDYGTKIPVSKFIWELARGDLNNGCSFGSDGSCIDNTINPINPAFILAIIQKESGLVYGSGSKPGSFVNNQGVDFRIDRATGYLCLETSDRSRSCWDENPEWKYFKGFFRQVYYSARWFRIWTQRCDKGPQFGHNGIFYTGNTVTIGGQEVTLKNGITCAMYIYTPHISDSTARVLRSIDGDSDFIEDSGRDPNHKPYPVQLLETNYESID